MKVKEFVKPQSRNKVLTYIAAAIIALMVFAVSMFVIKPQPTAHAATGGTVTVHVYDPAQEYSKLGAWMWIKGSSGKEYKISTSAASGEKFALEYSQNGTRVKNASRTFTMELTDAQVTSAKGGSQLGLLVCYSTGKTGEFWDRYDKETSDDVMVSLVNAFDANNNADVYYVRKDSVAHTDLEEALKTLEKITSASFTAKTTNSVTVSFESTLPLQKTAKATLFDGETQLAKANISVDTTNACKGTVTFATSFDFSKNYRIEVDNVTTGSPVVKTGFIDDVDFIKTYENADTQGLEYGAVYSASSTLFRVWAPFASSVKLNIYANGSTGTADDQYEMQKRIPSGGSWGGVWEYTLSGDQKGKYYTYSVANGSAETETIDPYAKACGANGTRGMVVDLDSTNPEGWKEDKTWYTQHATEVDTPIIWEVTVADFSSSSDSGMKYKGKYLAFTEQNTTVPGKPALKTGVNYLKDLGITYVHLNPVYDFATVDEADMTRADGGAFNWGYDPQNYNIPEGSYSTDPANGAVRINEFKRMVKALHDAGIGVVMDVVYNHTYSTGGQALHDTVPYYYHRTNENGNFTNGSGCGNETASERTMMRKYIIDSMTYWAKEYHIDGFRFDLMGVHDLETIKKVRTALDGINSKILVYGEPWSGDGKYVPTSFAKRLAASKTGVTGYATNPETNELVKNMFAGYDKNNALGKPESNYPRDMTALPDRVAVFNDSGREGIRGNNDPGKGWVSGNLDGKTIEKIMKMLEGGAGSSGDGMQTDAGSRSVAYAAAHDNYTLWDQIYGKRHGNESPLAYDAAIQNAIKQCKLAAAVYLTSSGMSFMLAGDEMGRTKFGNENSYNSPVKLNQIVWSRQEQFSDLYQFNKKLIGLRKKYSSQLFSYSKSTQMSYCYCYFDRSSESSGTIKYSRPITNPVMNVTLTSNSTTHSGTIKIGTDTLTI